MRSLFHVVLCASLVSMSGCAEQPGKKKDETTTKTDTKTVDPKTGAVKTETKVETVTEKPKSVETETKVDTKIETPPPATAGAATAGSATPPAGAATAGAATPPAGTK